MQTWNQLYTPLGSLWLSALVAGIPSFSFSSRWRRCA